MTADIGKHFLLKAIALHPKIREHINYKGTTHPHETYNSTEQRFSPTVGGEGCKHAEEVGVRSRKRLPSCSSSISCSRSRSRRMSSHSAAMCAGGGDPRVPWRAAGQGRSRTRGREWPCRCCGRLGEWQAWPWPGGTTARPAVGRDSAA